MHKNALHSSYILYSVRILHSKCRPLRDRQLLKLSDWYRS